MVGFPAVISFCLLAFCKESKIAINEDCAGASVCCERRGIQLYLEQAEKQGKAEIGNVRISPRLKLIDK